MPSDEDKLEAAYTAYLYDIGIRYVENMHYNSLSYLDKEKKKLRSAQGVRGIKSAIEEKSAETAHMLVSELKKAGVFNTSDRNIKIKLLETAATKYSSIMVEEIDKLISEKS